MLTAFTARPIIELGPKEKSRIETILAYGDRIFVGLSSGSLRVYRLNEAASPHPSPSSFNGHPSSSPSSGSRPPTKLLCKVDKFSTRAIEQLAIIKEANTIVSLSNYSVSLYDLQSYQLIETLARTKNASCFAVTSNIVKDADSGIPEIISRLAVAVKRRLLLWSWHESELKSDVEEVLLPESIRTLTWASATKLVCGLHGGYILVDATTSETLDIVGPGMIAGASQGSRFGAVSSAGMGYMGLGAYTPKPLAAKLAHRELLLAKDIHTLFINDDGKPIQGRRQIPWTSAPESIGYSYPYIVALQPPSRGSLEVRNPDSLSLLQTISLPGAAQLHFTPPTASLAHAGKGFHISSERCVWKMEATAYDAQVDELVAAGRYDEAISILLMLEEALVANKAERLREVQMTKAEQLFREKKFRQAMDLMNEDEVHAPPERVLKLFPPQIAGELSQWSTDAKAGRGRKTGTSRDGNRTPPPQPSSRSADSASGNIVAGSSKTLKVPSTRSRPAEVSSPAGVGEKSGAEDAAGMAAMEAAAEERDRPLEGSDLIKAVLELNSYLAGTRARLQRIIDPATGKLKPGVGKQDPDEDATDRMLRTTATASELRLEEEVRERFRLVDTTLFRAYMFSQPSLASSLFRIPNFCDADVVKEKLLEQGRFTELVDFLHGKKLHTEALTLLRRFGLAEEREEAAPALHGADRTIEYLQNLGPPEIDLILEHAGWTLEKNADYTMEIFMGDTERAESLPRAKVAAFLRGRDRQLERRYLEHVILELDDSTADFHNRLVELYVEHILCSPKGGPERDELMSKLVDFLRNSRQVYSLTKAWGLLPKEDNFFYEAQAIVLGNMGQHRKALEVYVFQMKDYAKAEEYCNRVYQPKEEKSGEARYVEMGEEEEKEEKKKKKKKNKDEKTGTGTGTSISVYRLLLSLYLQPPAGHETQLGPALDLLSRHGSRLPADSTLDLIPDNLPVGALEAYFRGRVRWANSLVNESRVVAGLRKAEGISVAARLQLGGEEEGGQGGRSRHVTISDERHCVVCHKKLGSAMRIGGSVVAVLPDNTAVHYGCLDRAMGREAGGQRGPGWGRGLRESRE